MNFYFIIFAVLAFIGSIIANDNSICSLKPRAHGNNGRTCRAHIFSWSYDAVKGSCVEFVYGGCGGNKNRFKSREECERKCPGKLAEAVNGTKVAL